MPYSHGRYDKETDAEVLEDLLKPIHPDDWGGWELTTLEGRIRDVAIDNAQVDRIGVYVVGIDHTGAPIIIDGDAC